MKPNSIIWAIDIEFCVDSHSRPPPPHSLRATPAAIGSRSPILITWDTSPYHGPSLVQYRMSGEGAGGGPWLPLQGEGREEKWTNGTRLSWVPPPGGGRSYRLRVVALCWPQGGVSPPLYSDPSLEIPFDVIGGC